MAQVRKASQQIQGADRPVGKAIDRGHLRQMTFSDVDLEHEVLGLFDRQAAAMLDLIPVAKPEVLSSLAHAVKGSARGIGAWHVARAAAALEADPDGGVNALVGTLVEARAEIAEIFAEILQRN
jgi:hypothetical protein